MLEMYKGLVNSPETTITNNINTADTIIYVLDPARVPDQLPNLMTLGTGTNAETVKVLSIDGNALTVQRGFQGVAKDWLAGTIIARNFTEYDHAAFKSNIEEHLAENASQNNVHGLRENTISLGNGSISSGTRSIAIGQDAESSAYLDIAIGRNAKATGAYNGAMAIGFNSSASRDYAIALGMASEVVNAREGVLGGSVHASTNKWIVPGDFTVNGTKNFEIPHPKPEKKATHRIRHGAVESPTAGDTLYRYKIQSTKENDMQLIDLPDYFIYLNKDVQIFVTPQGHFGNGYGVLNKETEQLEIHCQLEGEYNVLVIGTRNDDHQSVQDWNIKGVEREIGESWTGETYAFSVDEIIEIEEIKEVI